MKILFLAHRLPYPLNKGEKIRAYHELRYLGKHHTIDLFCFADSEQEASLGPLKDHCRRCYVEIAGKPRQFRGLLRSLVRREPLSCGFFFSRKLQKAIAEAVEHERYDAIFVFCSSMAQYLPADSRIPVILDLVDIDSAKWAQYAERSIVPWSWLYRREAQRLAAYERRWAAECACTLVSTAQEARLLGNGFPSVEVLANGVEISSFGKASLPDEVRRLQPYALFVGNMDYFPNVDAAEHFARDILPHLANSQPELKFVVAGRNPWRRVRRLARDPRVVVTGSVPDVNPYISGASVVVAPFRIAQGIQNKILEALAAGKPVVATSGPAAALGAGYREVLLVADNPQDFSAAIAAVLDDETLRIRFRKGPEFVSRHFCWDTNLERLDQILRKVAASSPVQDTLELKHVQGSSVR